MAGEAVRKNEDSGQQLALDEQWAPRFVPQPWRASGGSPLCAGCRAKEARYGFREHPLADRPQALCFECFRMELRRREAVAAQLARGWNAEQASLPLVQTLEALDRRRRRAQIAARHALE